MQLPHCQFQPWSLAEAVFKTATRHDREDARRDAKAQHVPSGDPRTDLIEVARLEDQALLNRLKERLRKGVLAAFGMPEGGVDPVRIHAHHLQSLSLNLADSTATNKNSKIVFEGVHVYPRLLAPDAERSLDGLPLARVIRDEALGDLELVAEFERFPPPPPYLALPPVPDAREGERARAWEAEHGTPEAAERRATELWEDWIARVHASPLPLMASKERLYRLWWEQPIKLMPSLDAPDRRPRWRTQIGPPLGAPDAGIVAIRLAALRTLLLSGRLQVRGRKLIDAEAGAYGPPEIVPLSVLEDRNTHVRLVHGDLVAMEGGRVVAEWSEVTLIDPAPSQQIPVDRAPRSAARGNGHAATSVDLPAPVSASGVPADGGEEGRGRNGGGRPNEEEECAALFQAVRSDPEALKGKWLERHVWEAAEKKMTNGRKISRSTLIRWGKRGQAADLLQAVAANKAARDQRHGSNSSVASRQPGMTGWKPGAGKRSKAVGSVASA